MERTCALTGIEPPFPVPKLAVFDMDGTVIEQESLVVLARLAGLEEQVAELTGMAMRGELGFREAITKRVELLGGKITSQLIEDAALLCSYKPGLQSFVSWLAGQGCKLVLNTDGFDWLAERVAKDLGFDACYCNRMRWEDSVLVGVDLEALVDGDKKAKNVIEVCQTWDIDIVDTVCFGDGANDLPMMQLIQNSGGKAFAVDAKPVVKEQADMELPNFVAAAKLFLKGA
jgi:phosphoserine phosphatase